MGAARYKNPSCIEMDGLNLIFNVGAMPLKWRTLDRRNDMNSRLMSGRDVIAQ